MSVQESLEDMWFNSCLPEGQTLAVVPRGIKGDRKGRPYAVLLPVAAE